MKCEFCNKEGRLVFQAKLPILKEAPNPDLRYRVARAYACRYHIAWMNKQRKKDGIKKKLVPLKYLEDKFVTSICPPQQNLQPKQFNNSSQIKQQKDGETETHP
jgi:hypothetical protein